MNFTYCDEKFVKNGKDWVTYLSFKTQVLKETYEKCVENKIKDCHLILNDYRANIYLKGSLSNDVEKMELKCEIEKQIKERIKNNLVE